MYQTDKHNSRLTGRAAWSNSSRVLVSIQSQTAAIDATEMSSTAVKDGETSTQGTRRCSACNSSGRRSLLGPACSIVAGIDRCRQYSETVQANRGRRTGNVQLDVARRSLGALSSPRSNHFSSLTKHRISQTSPPTPSNQKPILYLETIGGW